MACGWFLKIKYNEYLMKRNTILSEYQNIRISTIPTSVATSTPRYLVNDTSRWHLVCHFVWLGGHYICSCTTISIIRSLVLTNWKAWNSLVSQPDYNAKENKAQLFKSNFLAFFQDSTSLEMFCWNKSQDGQDLTLIFNGICVQPPLILEV